MLGLAVGRGGKRSSGCKGRDRRRRGREFAGQDYCAFEWDGDVRRKGYCVPALEIWAAGEGFSLPEVADTAAGGKWKKRYDGADGLGHDERGEGFGRTALCRTDNKS